MAQDRSWEEVFSMIRTRLSVIVLPALAIVLSSCGGTGEGLTPVNGKLVCDGQPAAGAILFFHRQAGESAPSPNAGTVIPSATVGSDGSFSVESAALGRGAVPGKYHVLVQWPESENQPAATGGKAKPARVGGKSVVVAKHDRLDPVPNDRLKGKYSDAANPRLTAVVKPAATDLGTLEITMK
jgi:hypothetical protein